MARDTAQDRGLLRFAEKVLALLNQGQFTATYKYAVLLGIMDLCMEQVSRSGAPPTSLTTLQVAEKVVELYWNHTSEYHGTNQVLRQSTGNQTKTLSAIAAFRRSTSFASISRARVHHRSEFRRLVREVEWNLIEMPLPRLQVVGKEYDPFIYGVSWDRDGKVPKREVTAYQRGRPSNFDNNLQLKPGAAGSLLALNSLLRPFIQAGWAAKVAQINGLEESRLTEFLFNVDRVALSPLRPGLVEIQSGDCFYCRTPTKGKKVEVDHFIPRSRYPDDRIDNLVAAHADCNRHKLDSFAAVRHIERWRARSENPALARLAEEMVWERNLEATLGGARSTYFCLPDGSQLWVATTQFEHSARTALELALT